MDLLSHFLSSMKVSSTSISRWRVHSPAGVDIDNFSPGYLLSHVQGEAISVFTENEIFVLEPGDVFMTPSGGRCRLGFAGTKRFTPLSDLPWEGTSQAQFDLSAHHATSMRVTVGYGEPATEATTELLGIAFELQSGQQGTVPSGLPSFILLRSSDSRIHQLINPAIDFLVSDHDDGYFGMATKLAELAVIGTLRGYILSKPAFPAGALRGMTDKRLQKALTAMHSAPAGNWSVPVLAATCGMSRSNFAARFVEQVGETPIEYLYKLRVGLAMQLLKQKNRSVAQVAEQVGFGSDRVFRNVFRKYSGQTAREYRRAIEAT